MITLGLDQSYTSSGYVVVNEAGEMTAFGTYKTDKTKDTYDRATALGEKIAELVEEHNVDSVRIEGLAFGIRGDATRDLAGLQYVVITTLRREFGSDFEVKIIAPTSLKKFATGSGKSDKAAMITSVPAGVQLQFTEAKYKKTTGLADLCDAYWLAKFKAE